MQENKEKKEEADAEVSKENEENKEDQSAVDFVYTPTELGKSIVNLLAEENPKAWEDFFTAFYNKELWFGAFIEKNDAGEDVLYPIPSVQEDGTENIIVFEKGSKLAEWYREGSDEDRQDIFLVAKSGDKFLLDVAPEAFEKFNLLISYGRSDEECFIVDKETLKIMREVWEDLKAEN